MPDIGVIGAVLSSIKTATEIAKYVRETDFGLDKAELKLKLADLVSSLADAKMELTSLQDVIDSKDKEIAELKDAFEGKDKLVRSYDGYYLADDDGKPTGDAFCAFCWEESHKQRRLAYSPTNHRVRRCNVCKTEYDAMLVRSNPANS